MAKRKTPYVNWRQEYIDFLVRTVRDHMVEIEQNGGAHYWLRDYDLDHMLTRRYGYQITTTNLVEHRAEAATEALKILCPYRFEVDWLRHLKNAAWACDNARGIWFTQDDTIGFADHRSAVFYKMTFNEE